MALLCLLTGAAPVNAAEADAELAHAAYSILRDRCYRCHGAEQRAPGLLVLERDRLVADREEDDPFVTPGDVDRSILWSRVDDGSMPPEEALPGGLPAGERETLRRWIDAGAPRWETERKITFISEAETLRTIAQYQRFEVPSVADQRFQRFFSIAHLYNNASVTELDLRLYRAALSKALNSMSRRPRLILPRAIDERQTIFAIDLRDYGWEQDLLWDDVLGLYPYGLRPYDADARRFFDQIASVYGGEPLFDGVPYIRADWFVATATRPPLYHRLADIPQTLADLERRLGVDTASDFSRGIAQRAGMHKSGVSSQNRLVEYRPSNNGAFWISYDFAKESGEGNLARFPLGPKFDGNPFNRFAFDHDGGEVIFELPNRLHGYMLVDKVGKRINAGPLEIVSDPNESSGSPLVVNGISCMGCHQKGTINLKDDIRSGHGLFAARAISKVRQLYPQNETMDDLLRDSSRDYLAQLTEVTGPFLLVEEASDGEVTDFSEPVSYTARQYRRNLRLEEVATELGLADPQQVRAALRNRKLLELGLGPLTRGDDGTIARAYWESRETGASIFHEAAILMGVGSAVQHPADDELADGSR